MSEPEPTVGVGPHPDPWPDDPRLDPVLLAEGDRRNVLDVYRYWSVEAIVADLDTRRHPFHVAIENWEHDRNIGTVVRTANAFLAAEVHIVGKRKWNRRGAMMTDVYQHVRHHDSIESLLDWAAAHDDSPLPVIGVVVLVGDLTGTGEDRVEIDGAGGCALKECYPARSLDHGGHRLGVVAVVLHGAQRLGHGRVGTLIRRHALHLAKDVDPLGEGWMG